MPIDHTLQLLIERPHAPQLSFSSHHCVLHHALSKVEREALYLWATPLIKTYSLDTGNYNIENSEKYLIKEPLQENASKKETWTK